MEFNTTITKLQLNAFLDDVIKEKKYLYYFLRFGFLGYLYFAFLLFLIILEFIIFTETIFFIPTKMEYITFNIIIFILWASIPYFIRPLFRNFLFSFFYKDIEKIKFSSKDIKIFTKDRLIPLHKTKILDVKETENFFYFDISSMYVTRSFPFSKDNFKSKEELFSFIGLIKEYRINVCKDNRKMMFCNLSLLFIYFILFCTIILKFPLQKVETDISVQQIKTIFCINCKSDAFKDLHLSIPLKINDVDVSTLSSEELENKLTHDNVVLTVIKSNTLEEETVVLNKK